MGRWYVGSVRVRRAEDVGGDQGGGPGHREDLVDPTMKTFSRHRRTKMALWSILDLRRS